MTASLWTPWGASPVPETIPSAHSHELGGSDECALFEIPFLPFQIERFVPSALATRSKVAMEPDIGRQRFLQICQKN